MIGMYRCPKTFNAGLFGCLAYGLCHHNVIDGGGASVVSAEVGWSMHCFRHDVGPMSDKPINRRCGMMLPWAVAGKLASTIRMISWFWLSRSVIQWRRSRWNALRGFGLGSPVARKASHCWEYAVRGPGFELRLQ